MPGSIEVAVLGAAAVDLVAAVPHLPRADELVLASSMARYPGGAGANVAVGAARLGCRVGWIGRLGNDANGRLLREDFQREGVDLSRCPVVEGASAACWITVDPAGARAIVALGGIGLVDRLDEEDLDTIQRARIFYLTDHAGDVAAAGLAAAGLAGIPAVYSPGGMIAAQGLAPLADLLALQPVLLLNRAEMRQLTGSEDARAGAAALFARGPRAVILTLGEQGALIAEKGGQTHIPAARAQRIVDTTGCGDAFAAGLLAGLVEGRTLAGAARFGAVAAAMKLSSPGARTGLPTRAQVDAWQG